MLLLYYYVIYYIVARNEEVILYQLVFFAYTYIYVYISIYSDDDYEHHFYIQDTNSSHPIRVMVQFLSQIPVAAKRVIRTTTLYIQTRVICANNKTEENEIKKKELLPPIV